MRVAWFDAEDWEREYLEEVEDIEIEFFEEPLNEDTADLVEGFDAVAVFVSSEVSGEVLRQIDVEIVACRSTGFDHVDLQTANEEGINVCNVPEYGANTVAEHTFALLLSLSRKIYPAVQRTSQDHRFDHTGLTGFDLKDKKLGVFGTGSIGLHAIRIAKGFGMDVIASDPQPKHDKAEEMGFMYVSKEDLIEQADIISLHCPLVDATRHMISDSEIEAMNETVILNTSRGELIDTEALLKGLKNGNVKCAGLDVLEGEGYIDDDISYLSDGEDMRVLLEDHKLMERDDVLVTPHNGFNSREALERIEDVTLENLREFSNVVNNP
jgi:D-lactate dehydrogenase